MASLFCSGRTRTDASGENVSPLTTGLRTGRQRSGVSVGKPHVFHFSLNMPVAGTVWHAYKKNRANTRWECVGAIVSTQS